MGFWSAILVGILAWAIPLGPANLGLGESLSPGDYRLTGPGVFRRIIVSDSRVVFYDIWRIRPDGSIQHLHFDLVSPAQKPVEATDYAVRSKQKHCGTSALGHYVDEQFVHPAILVMSYNGAEQALSSGARPLTSDDFSGDEQLLSDLRASAGSRRAYERLGAADRKALSGFVPQCH